jgi:hypothetical protein
MGSMSFVILMLMFNQNKFRVFQPVKEIPEDPEVILVEDN